MSQKRKCLNLKQKGELLESLSKGDCVTLLAKKYGIAKSTVCAIKKKRAPILKRLSQTFRGSEKTKTLKVSSYSKMERDLYKYFLNLRERNIPVSGLMLQEKAKVLQRAIDVNSSFNASNGWLNRFKKRYGIRLLQISGEKLSSQPELVDPFKEILRSTIERLDLTSEQIYNADETGLYWKLLPSKTYVSETEKTAPGRKTSKQRITFLACTNAAGNHKLKPLVLGKSKNPSAFRNFNLPVNYRSSKTAWMTMTIFREWFHNMFIPEVKAFLMSRNLPVKALLLLDNAPSHPPEAELKSPDGLITVLFMPPNVTPLIQPMDQNVIRITKLFYRKILLSQLLSKGSILSEMLQTYTLRDAVSNLALAWNMLKPIVIEKCWRNILTINLDDEDDNVPLSVLRVRLLNDEAHNASQSIIDLLQNINQNVECEINDINEWNKDKPANLNQLENEITIDSDSEEDDNDNTMSNTEDKLISTSQAMRSINDLIQWAEENGDIVEYNSLIVLHNLRQKIVEINLKKKFKQPKITSFFTHVP